MSAQTDPDVFREICSGHWGNKPDCRVVLDCRMIFQAVATSPWKTFGESNGFVGGRAEVLQQGFPLSEPS